jgi:hypothetical protein
MPASCIRLIARASTLVSTGSSDGSPRTLVDMRLRPCLHQFDRHLSRLSVSNVPFQPPDQSRWLHCIVSVYVGATRPNLQDVFGRGLEPSRRYRPVTLSSPVCTASAPDD